MAPMTAIKTFLARLATRFPDVEGAVILGDKMGWQVQDNTTELLDAEEIAIDAEGLLIEGFGMIWHAIADQSAPREPDHILLMFWQGPTREPPPAPGEGWAVLAQGSFVASGSAGGAA